METWEQMDGVRRSNSTTTLHAVVELLNRIIRHPAACPRPPRCSWPSKLVALGFRITFVNTTQRADGEVTLASYGASVSLRSTTGSHVARSSVLSEVMNSTQVFGHVQERH